MSDRGVVGTAAAVVLAALVAAIAAVRVPWALALAVALGAALVAAVSRRPAAVSVALVALVAGRAEAQLASLAAPLPDRLDGVASVVEDPVESSFGVRAVLSIDGRRYLAQAPWDLATPLRAAAVGDHLEVAGRPSPLRGAPVGWVRSRHLAGRLQLTEVDRGPPTAPWFAAANRIRAVYRAGSASFEGDRRALYLGMVTGDDRGLSDVGEFRFRAAGLGHLTAVSGQNVAFLLVVFAPVLGRLGRRGRVVGVVGLLVVMVLVTRAEPSVLRASVMAGLVAVALGSGRLATTGRILALTVTILVVVDPMLVHSLGFQLSVAATAGLVVLVGPIERRLAGPHVLRRALAATLAAQAATLPWVVALGPVSPLVVLANLFAVPTAGTVMMLGVVSGAVAGLVTEPIAAVVQLPTRLLVAWVEGVARLTTSAPIGALGPGDALALAGTIALTLRWWRDRRRWAVLAAAAALLLAVWVCWPSPPVGRSQPTDGVTLAVGRCGGVVVGVGTGASAPDAFTALHRLDVRRIDLVVTEPTRAARRTASALSELWTVRRTLVEGAAGRWSVGGVRVVGTGTTTTIELSEAACSLTA